jgi:hypothetical protein
MTSAVSLKPVEGASAGAGGATAQDGLYARLLWVATAFIGAGNWGDITQLIDSDSKVAA